MPGGRSLCVLMDTCRLAFLLTAHDGLKGPPEGETEKIHAICSVYVFKRYSVPHANPPKLFDIPER